MVSSRPVCLVVTCLVVNGAAFAPAVGMCSAFDTAQRRAPHAVALTKATAEPLPRRRFLFAAAALALTPVAPALAADNVWVSGKSDPIRPTSKDKPDGTKKDYKYIQCLNDCVPRKQGAPGPGQKPREECLDSCQQECCFTYQQCTYTIRK